MISIEVDARNSSENYHKVVNCDGRKLEKRRIPVCVIHAEKISLK